MVSHGSVLDLLASAVTKLHDNCTELLFEGSGKPGDNDNGLVGLVLRDRPDSQGVHDSIAQ